LLSSALDGRIVIHDVEHRVPSNQMRLQTIPPLVSTTVQNNSSSTSALSNIAAPAEVQRHLQEHEAAVDAMLFSHTLQSQAHRSTARAPKRSVSSTSRPSPTALSAAALAAESSQGHRFAASAVCWYPFDTGAFVSGGLDQQICVWDTNSMTVVARFDVKASITQLSMSAIASHGLLAGLVD
jgi:WD40 repeat protein